MNKTFLITRPSYDLATNYLFHWSKRLLEYADSKMQILDLKEKKANRKEFSGRAQKMKPELVVLNGHGSETVVTGHDNTPLVDMSNSSIVGGAIVYARSCSSAAILGPQCVVDGARAYIGYAQPFIFCYDDTKITHPLEDSIAAYCLEPSNQLALSLLKGHTAQEAHDRSKEVSRKQMAFLMSSEAPSEASTYLKYVWYNMTHQTCIGNADAKI